MTPAEVELMLREDHAEWDRLCAVLEAHAAERNVHAGATTSWMSRDVYGHLARWMDHSTNDLEARLQGRPPPTGLHGTDDEINALWQLEDDTLSLAETRERARAAFDRREQSIRAVPPARWDDQALAAIAHADGADHFRAHRDYIESPRKSAQRGSGQGGHIGKSGNEDH